MDFDRDFSDDENAQSYYHLSQSLHSTGSSHSKSHTNEARQSERQKKHAKPAAESGEDFPDPEDSDESEDEIPGITRQRTVLYDDVTEKQISQIEAKMFYQPIRVNSSHSNINQAPDSTHRTPTSKRFPASVTNPNRFRADSGSRPKGSKTSPETSTGFPSAKRSTSISHSMDLPNPGDPGYPKEATIPPRGKVDQTSKKILESEFDKILGQIRELLDIRRKYMKVSLQRPGDNPREAADWEIYPPPPQPVWIAEQEQEDLSKIRGGDGTTETVSAEHQSSVPLSPTVKRKPGTNIGEDFVFDDVRIPSAYPQDYVLEDGVYQVYEAGNGDAIRKPIISIPNLKCYYKDLKTISDLSSDGPSKTLAYQRLQCLEADFELYRLKHGYQETIDCKKVPHRDFYNVRKVDTHVHHSACMNQKHLLRFIKSKLKKSSDDEVLWNDGQFLTLAEVFRTVGLTAYDLSIDTLDMHAHNDTFHRFDKFNLKYNPVGESRLRNIFLKTDNDIKGRYLAEITKEVISDLESNKYQMVEWRISIYGRSVDEWDKLAAWVLDNKLVSQNVRWLIQIPRLYNLYQKSGEVDNFQDIIVNIFRPLFEVTKDPTTHPRLHVFLQRVIGFDSVDDESKAEPRFTKKFPIPSLWSNDSVVPYSYWIYYLFANMTSLNAWRKMRGFSTFVLRPHCGEAGDPDHLCAAFLCCHSISHGLLLRKAPLMQYCFYLEQIGIAMSPLSNNALFINYDRNPFPSYLKKGLNVSLSTDDPLQFAFTKEALMEEYSIATQIYKLTAVDMCELARNSVLQSGFEHTIKQHWLGPNYQTFGSEGNHPQKTNYPPTRAAYRERMLLAEFEFLGHRPNFLPAEANQRHLNPVANKSSTDLKSASKDPVAHSSPLFPAQVARSPPSRSSTDIASLGDPHIRPSYGTSGIVHEPRIFPGLVASMRQGSMHEDDDTDDGKE